MEKSWATILVSVIAGWLLGQITAIAKLLYQRRTLRRTLAEEVEGLNQGAVRIWLSLARSLQIATNRGLDNGVPLPLKGEVYRHHYKDALLAINKYQRQSLEMLYQYVEQVEQALGRLTAHNQEIRAKHASQGSFELADLDRYKDKIRALMYLVADIQWHARHYLEHPLLPDLQYLSPEHKAYVRYLDQVRAEIAKIERLAEGLGQEGWDNAYIPKVFDDVPDS